MTPQITISFTFPEGISSTQIEQLIRAAGLCDRKKEKEPENDQLRRIDSGRRYVYGLKGISNLFGVSKVTAQKYKDGILKDAVYQSGRKIVVDADKARALFIESGRVLNDGKNDAVSKTAYKTKQR